MQATVKDAQRAWEREGRNLVEIWRKDRRPYLYAAVFPETKGVETLEPGQTEVVLNVAEVCFRFQLVRSQVLGRPAILEVYFGKVHIADVPFRQ